MFAAAAGGDLDKFRQACTPQFYTAFVRSFGEAKYQRVLRTFDQVQRLGMPQWLEIRQRVMAGAVEAYDRLRQRVVALGRSELAKLPVERRMQLLDQQGSDAFLELGLTALPPEERRLVGDVQAFRDSKDRLSFAQSQAWTYASAEDKKALGSQAALSSENTPEKLAFLDRVGLPLVDEASRKELAEIHRSELQDAENFKFKYGDPLARAYLGQKLVPGDIALEACEFERADSRGGLMRGIDSNCVVGSTLSGGGAPAVVVALRKTDRQWLVASVTPPLYAAWPPAPSR